MNHKKNKKGTLNMKRALTITLLLSYPLVACGPSDDDVNPNSIVTTNVVAYYKDVILDWDNNTFAHNGYVITIPAKWGFGIQGIRENFKEYDPHDIVFKYVIKNGKTYGGEEVIETDFKELVYESPITNDSIFEINTTNLDIDSKILIKDELINDCYFKYDFNADFYNYCYFKMAKNDINQLKTGAFNQINVKLKYLQHIDSALSFAIDSEKDGLNNVGFYSNVSIAYNPDYNS